MFMMTSKQWFKVMLLTLVSSASFASLISEPDKTAQQERFRVVNQCSETIWIQRSLGGNPTEAVKNAIPTVVELPSGTAYEYTIPDEGLAATRFWVKKGCNQYGYNCIVGESSYVEAAGHPTDANGKALVDSHGKPISYQDPAQVFAPPIDSKFEATWACKKGADCIENPSAPGVRLNQTTWWNGSAVDGYTLPFAIHIKGDRTGCVGSDDAASDPTALDVNCGGLKVESCPSAEVILGKPTNLQWISRDNGPQGCFSPCTKIAYDVIQGGLGQPNTEEAKMLCCSHGVSSEACRAGPAARSAYHDSIHETQHCNTYAYAYDDAKGLSQCGQNTQFELVYCPASGVPVSTVTVDMKMMISDQALTLNGNAVTNGQTVSLQTGSKLALQTQPETYCTMKVDTADAANVGGGPLCTYVHVNNTDKTVTVDKVTAQITGFPVQFNYNTSVGQTVRVGSVSVSNAQVYDSGTFQPETSITVDQNGRQSSCAITLNTGTVVPKSGDLCQQLNIDKNAPNHGVNVYLPAAIAGGVPSDNGGGVTPPNGGGTTPPDNGGGTTPPVGTKSVVFGMTDTTTVKLGNEVAKNGSKVALESLPAGQVNLVATQAGQAYACTFTRSGSSLSIVPGSGYLCSQGLVLQTMGNGDYYIGLPASIPPPLTVGLPGGASVTVNDQTVQADSANKGITLPVGTTNMTIKGNSETRTCPLTLDNQGNITAGQAPGCVGVNVVQDKACCTGLSVHPGVIYIPAF